MSGFTTPPATSVMYAGLSTKFSFFSSRLRPATTRQPATSSLRRTIQSCQSRAPHTPTPGAALCDYISMWQADLLQNASRYEWNRAKADPATLHRIWFSWMVASVVAALASVTIIAGILNSRAARSNVFNLLLVFLCLPDFVFSSLCGVTCTLSWSTGVHPCETQAPTRARGLHNKGGLGEARPRRRTKASGLEAVLGCAPRYRWPPGAAVDKRLAVWRFRTQARITVGRSAASGSPFTSSSASLAACGCRWSSRPSSAVRTQPSRTRPSSSSGTELQFC